MNNLMRYLRHLNGRFSRFWTVATAAPNLHRPSKWCWWVRTATSTPSCAATWNSSPANRPTGRITSASTSYRSAADPTPSPATWPLSIDTTTSTSSPIHGVKVSHYPTGTSLSLSFIFLFCFVLFCFILFYFVLFCFILFYFAPPSTPRLARRQNRSLISLGSAPLPRLLLSFTVWLLHLSTIWLV